MSTDKEPFRIARNLKCDLWQILLPEHNVAVAEFYQNTTHSREEIERILNSHTELVKALELVEATLDEHEKHRNVVFGFMGQVRAALTKAKEQP